MSANHSSVRVRETSVGLHAPLSGKASVALSARLRSHILRNVRLQMSMPAVVKAHEIIEYSVEG